MQLPSDTPSRGIPRTSPGSTASPQDTPRTYAAESATATLARFSMTSDLRAATGITRSHLDFYLREGLVKPTARTESGYLLFDDRELALLREIIARRAAGESLADIRTAIGRQRGEDDA